MAIFGQLLRSAGRSFSTSAVRKTQNWQQEGIPGSNLPFDINNKIKLTLNFIIFFSTGLTAPFLLMRRHLLSLYTPETVPIKSRIRTKPVIDEVEIDGDMEHC
ncbi:unnamed protein product [Lymnaea stagnalis]|uniref:Cytochrome c oxidase polypeptide VIIc n=1 Tax=Lymnaea stagnalis TaxID=6523 RepID=A0AAV2HDP3_LYMST